MEPSLKFSIQNLLSRNKEGKISAPMSPMLFAKEMAEQVPFKFNCLARVWFEDERMHQHREDGGYTGYDTLIIGCRYSNDLWLSIWVDCGVYGIPVAMRFQSDKNADVKSLYLKTSFAAKLNEQQINEIFDHIFSNPQTIDIEKQQG